MNDLTEFLRARLDEDEAADLHERKCSAGYYGAPCTCGWRYRKVREIEAKRAILDDHESEDGPYFSGSYPALRRLAAIYSDHPDYRPEWATAAF